MDPSVGEDDVDIEVELLDSNPPIPYTNLDDIVSIG